MSQSLPTHRVVTRDRPNLDDWDREGRLCVENRVIGIAMDYGTAVDVRIDPAHAAFDRTDRQLTVTNPTDEAFDHLDAVHRGALPADRSLIESLLAVPDDDTDAWSDRLFMIDELVVRADDGWLYRSVPHETHIRMVNAQGRSAYLRDLRAALDAVRRSTIVPEDGLVAWESEGVEYDLQWDVLRRHVDGRFVPYDLERLLRVGVDRPDRLCFEWEPLSDGSLLKRVTGRLLAPGALDPPTCLPVDDSTRLDEIIDGFRRLRSELGYEYRLPEPE